MTRPRALAFAILLLCGIAGAGEPATPLPSLDERFAQLDRDGDGRLSRDEFRWSRLFDRLDADANGNLTLDEVRAMDRAADRAPAPALVMKTLKDIRYASMKGVNPNLLGLDVYAPTSGARHPVIVMVHGGGWRIGDKAHAGLADAKSKHFTAAGYIFVSVNYRLSPAVTHPAHVQDVAAALAFVHDHAREWGGEPDRMYVMGHSAGAHLAALVAIDGRYLRAHGKSLAVLKGAILLDGAGYDITRNMTEFRGGGLLVGSMYKSAFGTDPKVWRDASPITHVAPGADIPPFVIFYVGHRKSSRTISHALAEKLVAAGSPAWPMAVPGASHASISKDVGTPGDWVTEMIMSFLEKYPVKAATPK